LFLLFKDVCLEGHVIDVNAVVGRDQVVVDQDGLLHEDVLVLDQQVQQLAHNQQAKDEQDRDLKKDLKDLIVLIKLF
jgi:hypothetical protein